MQEVRKLREIGERKVLQALRLKAVYADLFDGVTGILYRRREPMGVRELCTLLGTEEHAKIRYILKKLLGMGFIEVRGGDEREGRYVLSQAGLDFFRRFNAIPLDEGVAEALSKRHAFRILLELSTDAAVPWSKLWKRGRTQLNLGESSLFNILRALQIAGLVTKSERGYILSERGEEVRSLLLALAQLEVSPAFELQLKLRLSSDPPLISEKLPVVEERHVHQKDYYLVPKGGAPNADSYLRYRIEEAVDSRGNVISAPKHVITWMEKTEPLIREGIYIVRRRKEEIEVPYPSAIFLLEHLGVKIRREIEKDRTIFDTRLGVRICVDTLRQGEFLEIKAQAWGEKELEEKCELIREIVRELDLEGEKIVKILYHEM